MRGILLTQLVGVAALVACGGNTPTNGAPPNANDVPPVAYDVPRDCSPSGTVAATIPVIALEWDRALDTFLPLGSTTPTELAIDYEVAPRARVDEVAVEWDFDRTVTIPPATVREACPAKVTLAAIGGSFDFTDTDNVYVANIAATGTDGDRRDGRVSFTTGGASVLLQTAGLDAGLAANGPWWAVFEPASGEARVAIAQVRLDLTSMRIVGLPSVPGEIALIQTNALREDSVTHAIYGPRGFAEQWRELARGWYGALLTTPPNGASGTPLELRTIVSPRATHTTLRDLSSSTRVESGTSLVTISSRRATGRITVPCTLAAIRITPFGFGAVTVGDATASPGSSVNAPVTCASGAATGTIDVSVDNYNARRWPLIVTGGAR